VRATLVVAALLMCPPVSVAGRVAAQSNARYAQAMGEELQKLGIDATCAAESPQRHRCSFNVRSSLSERALGAHAVYDDTTDSVYIFVEELLTAPPADKRTNAVLRRMMELNWELLLGKFEWNPSSGEVRLSVVLSTDSNFDRRAFRSAIRTLDTLAPRYRPELAELLKH
jgi:hypothetical protein